ncbi:hypothetical protein A3I18_00995 [Candidatus Campbellbacteria bacterium RIFCSPLOWO2_02_FULL_35_11]|uniref:Peptidase MA-like domain-containing protein n=2 Tax=Candidatus Campbelliibacteriota TaxID=1752727 RepID=A0A1F5EQK2_9BACT|nr:MAG: hypothetical protein A3I18_00995 [Candidatus Campbellbacteria bacterium RIFCSPLOWO2_02_FULL_35_11]
MIFELKQKKDKFLDKAYKDSMKELNDFYGINWTRNTPKIFIVNSREDKALLKEDMGNGSADWTVGWTPTIDTVFVMNRLKIKTETSHKKGYTKEQYKSLIKHELSHLFFKILVKGGFRPVWLWEGVAIYTSEQDRFKKRLEEFKQFLNFYDSHMSEDGKTSVYYESGFFVEMLVEKFGKKKFLNFLKSLQKVKNRKEFDNLFFKTYKFKLNYKEINKSYKN